MKPPAYYYQPLLLMKAAYDHSDTEAMYEWRRSRTDDVMFIDDDTKMTLVFLGTQPKLVEWFWNIAFRSEEWLNMGRVHRGFAKNVHELLGREDQPFSLLNRCLIAAADGKKISLLGHSRGYPLACLAATLLVSHGVPKNLIRIVGCGGARVGNSSFNMEFDKMFHHRANVINAKSDPVPYLPPWGRTNGTVTKISLGWVPKHLLKHYIDFVSKHI